MNKKIKRKVFFTCMLLMPRGLLRVASDGEQQLSRADDLLEVTL